MADVCCQQPGVVISLSSEIWRHGQVQAARNQVQRLTKQLRQKYYEKKVNGLRTSNPRNWWRAVKQITGLKQKSTEPLVGLAQRIQDGDVHALAGNIKFFQQVSADLRPLSDSTTPPTSDVLQSEFVIELSAVERKLSRINVYKAPGPDGLPNWILRDFCTQLSRPVCAIFNASVREGTVPACSLERSQCDSGPQSSSISSDWNRFAANLTDGDIEQVTGIVRWHVDTGQDPRQAGCPPVWSTERSFYDSRTGGHDASLV